MGLIFQAITAVARQVWTQKRWVFLFYGVNLMMGVLFMIPVYRSVKPFAGRSLMGKKLAGLFNLDFLFEWLFNQDNLLPILIGMLVLGFTTYMLVSLFLSGGAYQLFAAPHVWTAAGFWAACGRYFWPVSRLVLAALPIFAVLVAGAHYLEVLLKRLLFGALPYEYIT